jgi:DNA-binding transcriptional MerR regulator
MNKNLPARHLRGRRKKITKSFVSIGEAARILDVSIDTVRRWDKSGKLQSTRLDGKNRYFAVKDLGKINKSKSLTISEAAQILGVSASTLRRYEARGLIKPQRNEKDERRYKRRVIEQFIKRPGVDEVVRTDEEPKAGPVTRSAIRSVKRLTSTKKAKREIKINIALPHFDTESAKKVVANKLQMCYKYAFVTIFLVITSFLSFMYIRDNFDRYKSSVNMRVAQVLGARDQGGILGFTNNAANLLRKVGVQIINEHERQYRLVYSLIKKITEKEKVKEVIVTQEIVNNLNAKFVQGKAPGEEKDDLAYFAANGIITALRVSSTNLLPGSVTTADLADDAVTGIKILNDTIKNEDIASSAINSAKIEDDTITYSDIKDGTIKEADLSDNSVTTGKITNNTITASDLAATLTFANGDFVDLSAINHSTTSQQGLVLPNVSAASPSSPSSGEGYLAYDTLGDQVIVYDGSTWSQIGGSITLYTTADDDSTTSSISGLELLNTSELSLIRGCSDTQVLKWNETSKIWYCADDSGSAGAGISTVEENNVSVVTSASNIDFLGADFNVTDAGGGEADIAIDYSNSGITRDDQTQTISGGWTFSNLTISDTNVPLTGGDTTVDVTGAATRTFTLLNSTTSQVANLDLSDGSLLTGGISRLTNAGVLQNITGLTVTGDITANDSDADTILIGQSGTTDDIVTIAGNVSITDDNWSISATGATTGLTGITADSVSFANVSAATNTNALVIGNGGSLSTSGSGTIAATTATDLISCSDCIGAAEVSTLTLGSDTDGNYVAGVTANEGLTMTGTEGGTLGISLQANKGLEVDSNGLSLVDCGNNQILKYSTGTNQWSCQDDATGGGSGTLDDAYNAGTATIVVDSYDVTWQLNDVTDDYNFVIDNTTTGAIAAALEITTSGSGATIVTAIDVSDADIGTALAIGSNDITTTSSTLSAAELDILDDGITLGTDTAGNYVASITDGNGITGGDGGGVGSALTLAIQLLDAQDSGGSTSSRSGLEFGDSGNNELTLLQGCNDGQVMEWDEDTHTWGCATDDAGAGSQTLDETYNQGTATVVVDSYDVTWQLNDASNNYNFVIDNTTTGEIASALEITTTGAGGTFATGIDVSDSGITDAINIGTNNIVTGATTVASTELDILDSGIALSELTDSGTLTASGNVDFADAGADTITIGDANDTTSITGSSWSIASDGSTTGLSGITADSVAFSGVTAATNTNALVIGTGGSLTTSGTGTITATDLSCTNCIGSTEVSDLTLGTDTAGNYVAGATIDAGLTMTGTEGGTLGISLQANKGLEVDSNGLSLVDCGNNQILKYSTGTNQWSCQDDATGGGGTLQEAYDAGNTITTDATGDITITLAELGTPTMVEIFNEDTAGVAGLEIDNTIASGTLTSGLLLEQSGAGTMTSAINIVETTGTITTGVNIGSGVGTAIVMQSGESIDNTTNNQINMNLGTSGTLLLTSATAATITNSAGTLTIDAAGGTVDIPDGLTANSVTIDTGALAVNTASGITSDQSTFLINAGGTVDIQDALSITGALSGVTTLASSDDWTWSATSPTVTLNTDETFTISDAGGTFNFSVSTGPNYTGDARPTRQVTLSPEYQGATLTGDGGSNTGTMTSDFCAANSGVGNVPATNTSVCNTAGDIHDYYSWTTGQGSAQDYDIWIRWRVPDNFSAWASNPIDVYGKRTDASNNAVAVYVYDTVGTLENAGGTQVAGTSWTSTTVEATFAGTYTAGSYMTIRIAMTADTGGDSVQVGEINLDYLSSN